MPTMSITTSTSSTNFPTPYGSEKINNPQTQSKNCRGVETHFKIQGVEITIQTLSLHDNDQQQFPQDRR